MWRQLSDPLVISKTAVLTEAISNRLTMQKKNLSEKDYIILPYYGNMPGVSPWRIRTYEDFAVENKSPWLIYCCDHCFNHCKKSIWKALQPACLGASLMLYMRPAALPGQAGKEWWPGWQLSHWSPATPERQRHIPRKLQISGWVPATLHSHTANEKRHFRGSLCTGSLLLSFFK